MGGVRRSGVKEQTRKQKNYEEYVRKKTPVHKLGRNMLHAFFTGGLICTAGQVCFSLLSETGMDRGQAGSYTSLLLVLLSVFLTGTGIYPKIAKWGGAGALVPITGFANSVAAPAIEYKKEGQIFGIGCKIFTIAGPVILYGIVASWFLGLIYYLMLQIGISI